MIILLMLRLALCAVLCLAVCVVCVAICACALRFAPCILRFVACVLHVAACALLCVSRVAMLLGVRVVYDK